MVKEMREHLGLTQNELADQLQVRQQTISGWESRPLVSIRRSNKLLLTRFAKQYQYKPTAVAKAEEEQ